MFERNRFKSHLPEREPQPEDFQGVDGVDVVHLRIDGEPTNPREALVLRRLQKLQNSGVKVREVGIETEPENGDKNVAVGGVLGDVCAPKRRGFLRKKGINAKVDTSLTSDY